jgi:hypothetical protein
MVKSRERRIRGVLESLASNLGIPLSDLARADTVCYILASQRQRLTVQKPTNLMGLEDIQKWRMRNLLFRSYFYDRIM